MTLGVRVMRVVAVGVLLIWLISSTVMSFAINLGPFFVGVSRPGFGVSCLAEGWTPELGPGEIKAEPPDGDWWFWPQINNYGFLQEAIFPHWLAALIAWTWFLLIRRQKRAPVEGKCPDCGYDLTANRSGVCPECGSAVQPPSVASVEE